MRFFTCILDPSGRGIPEGVLQAYEALPRGRGLWFRWYSCDQMAVLTAWDDPYGPSLVAQGKPGDWAAVGVVRLDNRQELMRWVERDGKEFTDLELVRRAIAENGIRYVPNLLGDFAFVAWHARTRTGVGACDALAVEKMFHAEHDGLIAFASRAEALAIREGYDSRYLTQQVALYPRTGDNTVYTGVRTVPAGSAAVLRPGHSIAIQRYWTASDYSSGRPLMCSEQTAVEVCRELLADSIRLRMGRKGETWAQLSGGIDSSSVVSCAQWLAKHGGCADGLAGTVTFVDRSGTTIDEREFSRAVVNFWKVPNSTIVDPPLWYDDTQDMPHLDQPSGALQVFPRNRRMCAVVRGAGGRVLLTGLGGDQLFAGTMLFFADWIARGRVSTALREMARRAALGRVSFWELAYRNAALPLLPQSFRDGLVHDQDQTPSIPWIERKVMNQSGLARRRAITADAYGGRLGHKYEHCVAWMADTIDNHYHGGVVSDVLEVRHPMLYRPLVEFALQLPPYLRARPHEHRWVLRRAMEGILPESVRTRVGKPRTGDFLAWSLMRYRQRLAPLIREPILAELGIVDPAKLRAGFHYVLREPRGAGSLCAPLLNTLAVEAWLRIRSGRWPFDGQYRGGKQGKAVQRTNEGIYQQEVL